MIRKIETINNIAIVYDVPTDVPKREDGTESEFEMMPSSSVTRLTSAIFETINITTHQYSTMDFYKAINNQAIDLKADVVFNLSSGVVEKYRYAQSPMAFEILGIPYSGSDVYTILLCRDKYKTNNLLRSLDIKVPTNIYWHKKLGLSIDEINKDIFPCFVKPNFEGGSVGVSDINVAHNHEELTSSLQSIATSHEEGLIIEEFIHGLEVTVLVLGNIESFECYSMGLANKNGSFLSPTFYRSQKEKKDAFETGQRTWFPLDDLIGSTLKQRIEDISRKACIILNIKDIARLDFRVRDQDIYLLEVNAQPAFTEGNTSLYCISKHFFKDDKGVEKKFIEVFINRCLTQ
jgi:D-alanine-D-alanine ligase